MNRHKIPILSFIIIVLVIFGVFLLKINKSRNGEDLDAYNKTTYKENSEIMAREEGFSSKEESLVDEPIKLEEDVIEPLKFLFFGDVMLDRNVAEILKKRSLTALLSGLRTEDLDFFQNKDLVSANLEGAVTNDGKHYSPVNKYDFAFEIGIVEELKNYNFNYFALANNHFFDQGQLGVDETRENLTNSNFYFSGAPDAKIDEYSRQDVEIRDKDVAMISLSMVYNHFDRERAKELIIKSKKETDLVIVNIHWGNEYEHNFNFYQQEVGRILVEAGADIIIGHHPHVVQGIEIYQGQPIFYSLGNFIFDQYFSAATQEGLALEIVVDDDKISVLFLPFNSVRSAPSFLNKEEKKKFLDKYITWSKIEAQVEEEIRNGYLVIK